MLPARIDRTVVRRTLILGVAAGLLLRGLVASAAMPVLITIDTETSSGCSADGCFPGPLSGRIYGVKDGRIYGIALVMDLLEKHGMRGTFFVNAYLDSWYPEDDVAEMVRGIISRGHDVQFHAHAEFRCFRRCDPRDHDCRLRCLGRDGGTAGTSFENQLEVLREGARNIERWTGHYPVAFRGGALRADANTLRALAALNIKIDSSFSGPGHELEGVLPVNQLTLHEGVLEMPLLAYGENLPLISRVRFLDQESSIEQEQIYLLDQAAKMGIGAVPLIMHSFSFCDPELVCPVPKHVERFDALLGSIARQPERFTVMTMREFWAAYERNPQAYLLPPSGKMPTVSYWLVLRRSLARFDQGWMNVAFLFANLVAAVALLLAAAWGVRRFSRGNSS
ncbi:MAG: polysaccharide deacetylase family protein [Gammaproteobacteria bacterium]|nr:polysaccharide deacetylase family protein [Gammaproteobacteria bacterium]